MEYLALRIVYILNIIVAGQISVSSIINKDHAATTIFGNAYQSSEFIKLIGCMWLAIAILSILGLWKPMTFTPVLLIQLIYKGTWLLVVALPAMQKSMAFPKAVALFFLVWVIFLPFVIPWKTWLSA